MSNLSSHALGSLNHSHFRISTYNMASSSFSMPKPLMDVLVYFFYILLFYYKNVNGHLLEDGNHRLIRPLVIMIYRTMHIFSSVLSSFHFWSSLFCLLNSISFLISYYIMNIVLFIA